MPYYRGDYVGARSNYYRGDPFLGGLIAGAATKLIPKAGKWIASKITGSSLKKATVAAATAATAAPILMGAPKATNTMPINLGPIGIDPTSILPGGDPFITFGKKKYRRMNPLNPKALKRALRRAEGFEKFARQTVNALRSGPKKFKSAKRKRS